MARSDPGASTAGQTPRITGTIALRRAVTAELTTTAARSPSPTRPGAATTVRLDPRWIPAAFTEVLLLVRLAAGPTDPGSAHLTDLDTDRRRAHLTGSTGLLHLGALQRSGGRWHLQIACSGLDQNLAALAAVAASGSAGLLGDH